MCRRRRMRRLRRPRRRRRSGEAGAIETLGVRRCHRAFAMPRCPLRRKRRRTGGVPFQRRAGPPGPRPVGEDRPRRGGDLRRPCGEPKPPACQPNDPLQGQPQAGAQHGRGDAPPWRPPGPAGNRCKSRRNEIDHDSPRDASRSWNVVQRLVDSRYLLDPPPPVPVFHPEQLLRRPVEVIGNEGYLPVEPVEGVAQDSPAASASTSKPCRHCGQVTASLRGCGAFSRL